MARIVGHLPVEELETRYRAARDATAARHYQAIWLLAQGRTILEVAEVLAFVPRWVTRLAARYNARGPAAPRPRGPAAPRPRGPAAPRRSAMGGGATARPPACSPRTCWPPWPSG
jgi:Winged helix-turn helix